MSRPTIPLSTQDAIAEETRPGRSRRDVQRALQLRGIKVSLATLAKYQHAAIATRAPDAPAPREAKQAQAALDSDDVEQLRAARAAIERAMVAWQGQLHVSRFAVQAYGQLTRYLADVVRALVELAPREDQDASRLEALGEEARATLLERLRANAAEDARLRIINARLLECRRRCTCGAFASEARQ